MVLDVPLQETCAGEPPVPRFEVFGQEMVFPGRFGWHCFFFFKKKNLCVDLAGLFLPLRAVEESG